VRIARTLMGLLVFSFTGLAVEPVNQVYLPDLIQQALARNPEILAARKRHDAATRRPMQEGALPDPIFSVSYSSNGGPLPGQGLGSNPTSNIGFMASQQIPRSGKRQLREAMAGKDAEAELEAQHEVEVRVRSEVTQAFHRLHHAYEGLAVLERGKDLLKRFIEVAEARYAVGKASQQDVLKAQTELALMETRILQMEQDQRSARSDINRLLARDLETPFGVPIENDLEPMPFTLAEVLRAVDEHAPALQRAERLIQRNQFSVNLAEKELHADYTVAAGYFNQGSMPPMFQVRVDVPLLIHANRKQRPAIAEQSDLLEEARQNSETTRQNLRFLIRDQYQSAQTAFRLMQLYRDTVLPQSGLTVESALVTYQNGSSDFLSVLTTLVTQVDAQERFHEAILSYSLALAKLEELVGAPVAELEAKR
jgi:cobalt-zinc-cadmium efflux system outer membrane protein